ncbi:hypothetical protein BOTBODRAFT_38535 [Botryobasidium botryosum FD-172 SS1]|uniref:Hydrophobic surface binding protein n=1 Tax=Botryobasidium botryosum (strain FD-172 SS1) TaxID=930990 RepID=A0A067LX00_BOTB1|nr:hypothetical protein BOTBODRAFT_38535 [Botryobasidium botryosum FD-172 SS1]
MVRINAALYAISCLVLSAASSPIKRDVSQIKADITKVSQQTVDLDNAITAFTGNLNDALAINTKSQTLTSTVKAATSDVQNADDFSEDDGKAIGTAIDALVPQIESSLTHLVQKKSTFPSFAISTVQSDLQALSDSNTDFSNALASKVPDDEKDAATAFQSQIEDAFKNAIAQYAS